MSARVRRPAGALVLNWPNVFGGAAATRFTFVPGEESRVTILIDDFRVGELSWGAVL
jgi:hypothetical protein